MAITGVPRICTRLVAYSAHTNSGSRNQVNPGARIRWIVTMKFRPVRIDEKPVMKTPMPVSITLEFEASAAVGRVERPAGVHAADDHRVDGEEEADDEDVPAEEVDLRERDVLGPEHQRQHEVAENRRHGGNQHEEHHRHAVHGEEAGCRCPPRRSRPPAWSARAGCPAAKMPPRKNANVTTTRYIRPMRLWSLVRSHEATPCS